MYRRFWLSTHRKNEFRKARAAHQQGQQGVTAVTLTVESVQDSELDLSQPLCPPALLIVSVPLQSVSLFTISLDKSVYLHIPVYYIDVYNNAAIMDLKFQYRFNALMNRVLCAIISFIGESAMCSVCTFPHMT